MLACAIVVSIVMFLRGSTAQPTVQPPTTQAPGVTTHDGGLAPSAQPERADRETVLPEQPSVAEPAAWAFDVVDRSGAPVESAEVVGADRVLARSNREGRVALTADAIDALSSPRPIVWSVRHPRHRAATLDVSRIGRVDRIVLDDPWSVHVRVQDEAGAQIAGAACALYGLGASTPLEIAHTDSGADGSTRFDDLVVSGARLSIHAAGFEAWERELLANVESDRDVTTVLGRSVDLRVRVSDTHGEPVPGAHVEARYELLSASENAPTSWDEITNNDGVTVLAGFPRSGRTMRVSATAERYAGTVQEVTMDERVAAAGVDIILTSIGRVHVRLHEADGTPRAATISGYYADRTYGEHGAETAKARAGAVIGEYVVEARTGVELELVAQSHGSVLAVAKGIVLHDGETRDVDLVAPKLIALDVHAAALKGACGSDDDVTLTATDNRQQVPAYPPFRDHAPEMLRYSAGFDADCHARMWVQPGAYRVALIHGGRALIVRDVSIIGAQTLELSVDAERTISGVLHDTNKLPLAGWTIVAHQLGGRERYSTRTSADGRFTINAVAAKAVEISAMMPSFELTVPVADSVAPPATDLELTIALFTVDVHTMDRDDGSNLGSRIRTAPAKHAPHQSTERATDDEGNIRLELPVGEWRIDATSGDHDRIGSTVLSVQSGGTASASIYLRKVRHRVFSISGAADADGVRWTSLEGPDAAEGTLSLSSISDAKGVDTDLPDGRTRFELTRAGEVIGTPISLRVTSAGPIVLAW